MLTIKNKTKSLKVLSGRDDKKAHFSIHLEGGETVSHPHLTKEDVSWYTKRESIEILENPVVKKAPVKTTGADTTEPAKTEPVIEDAAKTILIVLPELPTAENMKEALTVDELKAYCKQEGIKKYSKLKEDELIALILEALNAKV